MDKYEYNLRNEEINDLMSHRDYVRAVEIADTIDWTRVRSVKTLCKISDLYKVNKRYDEAKVLLEQAYEKMPTGKPIVSSLCELCIKMGDVVGATEYYKRYVQMAPTSNQKFVLLYKIYEAQDVSLEERIQVLEELNKREPAAGKGKWSYELASLYNRIGLTTKCVQQCDELITLLREGRYVKKAMELKMLHQQLTSSQEMLYKNISSGQEAMTGYVTGEIEQEQITDTEQAESTEEVREEADMPVDTVADTSDNSIVNVEPHEELVKTVDVGQYSTINIQKALEESIKGTLGSDSDREESEERYEDETKILPSDALNKFKSIVTDDSATDNEPSDNEAPVTEDTPVASSEESSKPGSITETIMAPMMQDTGEMEEIVFPDEPVTSDTIVFEAFAKCSYNFRGYQIGNTSFVFHGAKVNIFSVISKFSA